MKIRTDHVTNSSSSSFLLLFRDKMPDSIGVNSPEKLKAWWKKHFGWNDADDCPEVYEEGYTTALEHTEKGLSVIRIDMPYGAEGDDASSIAVKLNATCVELPQ